MIKIPYSLNTQQDKNSEKQWLDIFFWIWPSGIFIGSLLDIPILSFVMIAGGVLFGLIFHFKIWAVQFRTDRYGWLLSSLFLPFVIIFYYFGLYRPFLKGRKKLKDIEAKEEIKPLKKGEKRCPYCKYNCPEKLYEKHIRACDKNPQN